MLQEPFRRLAECEGLTSTADTTGTLGVHRCCENLNKSSGLFRSSMNQGINDVKVVNEACEYFRILYRFNVNHGIARY
jgi:hypothetical protein